MHGVVVVTHRHRRPYVLLTSSLWASTFCGRALIIPFHWLLVLDLQM
jgi:hypothetical protein